jgi:RNA polymerase sigma factor (sigma-70 family)
MSSGEILTGVVRHLRRQCGDAPSDGDLLVRFAAGRDEAAFAELVRRHGGLVLGVARRQLGDRQRAEDVFQATFLALARQAPRLGRPDSLVNWLYTVALRQARKTQLAVSRRAARHARLAPAPAPADPLSEITGRELVLVLDEELARLPEAYRLPLLLCAVEGLSREEAAQRLGWSPGAVKGRLERGRELLRGRLAARGMTVPAVLAGLLAADATAAVPRTLIQATARAAVGVLAAPGLIPLKSLVVATIALLALGVGAGATLWPGEQAAPAPVPGQPAPAPPAEPAPRVDAEGVPLPPGVLARLGSSRMRPAAAIDLFPDGRLVASIGRHGLRFWDAATGRLVRRIDVDPWHRPVVRFAADGRELLYTTGYEPTVFRRMDLVSGRELLRIELGGIRNVDAVVISPSGRRLAVSDDGVKEVRVYDTATGDVVRRIPFTGKRGFDVGISHDDQSLAVGDLREELDVYDLASGRRTATVKEPGLEFGLVRFAPDGRTLITIAGSWPDYRATVWDLATGSARYRLRSAAPEDRFEAPTFSPDGSAIAIGNYKQELTLYDSTTGRELRRFPGLSRVEHTVFSRDGRTIAGVSSAGTIVLWDVATGRLLPASADPVTQVHEVWFADGGRRLVGAVMYQPAVSWDPATGREIRRSADALNAMFFRRYSPDERLVAGVTPEGTIQVYDAATGRVRYTLRGEKPFWIHAPRFSPDGRRLFASDRDGVVWICDTADGKVLHRLTGHANIQTGHPNIVDVLVASPDGRWLATASDDRDDSAIRLWDLATYQEVRRFATRRGTAWAVAFSPDGRRMAAVGGDHGRASEKGKVQVWDLETGKERPGFVGHTEGTTAVAFSPDGRTLATGGMAPDSTVRLWEIATGAERTRFTGHAATIDSVAFSPDGRTLAVSSEEAPVYVWDVYGSADRPKQPPTPAELDQAWAALAGGDAKAAFQAVGGLVGAPDRSVALLRDRLKPAAAVDATQVRELIRRLDNAKFADRHAATAELEALGDRTAAELRASLKDAPSAEVRATVQRLLDRIDGAPDSLRAIRAVEALEHIATPAAREHLRVLARGQPGATVTQAAAEALRRLGGR